MKRLLLALTFAVGMLVTPMLTSGAGAAANPDHASCAALASLPPPFMGWGWHRGLGPGGISDFAHLSIATRCTS